MKIASNTEWLFFHLWKKNPYTLTPCENIYIADTILYRWAHPHAWYYMSKDGEITRKTKDKITGPDIETHFNANLSITGVVASYITPKNELVQKVPEIVEFEYFDVNTFKDFLYKREKALNAVLQKFVEPKNNRNFVIKVSWTPQFCLLYKKTNIHELTNQKVSLPYRIATFEGSEHICEAESVASSFLSQQLQNACNNMVNHIEIVSGGNIQIVKLVVYFKLDSSNRLWLLHCTGVKFREKGELLSTTHKLSKAKVPRNLSPILTLKDVKHGVKKAELPKRKMYHIEGEMQALDLSVCFYCDSEGHLELYTIELEKILQFCQLFPDRPSTYKALENNEVKMKKPTDALLEDPLALPQDEIILKHPDIPACMYKLYPLITWEKFQKLKKDKKVLDFVVKVCEDCYLQLTEMLINSRTTMLALDHQRKLVSKLKQEEDPNSFKKLLEIANNPIKKEEISVKATPAPNKSPRREVKARTWADKANVMSFSKTTSTKPKVTITAFTEDKNHRTSDPKQLDGDGSGGNQLAFITSIDLLRNSKTEDIKHINFSRSQSENPEVPSRKDTAIKLTQEESGSDREVVEVSHFNPNQSAVKSKFRTIVGIAGEGTGTQLQAKKLPPVSRWKKETSNEPSSTDNFKQTTLPSVNVTTPRGHVSQYAKTSPREHQAYPLSVREQIRGEYYGITDHPKNGFNSARSATSKESARIWTGDESKKKHKNNYTGISNTIRDLRSFLMSDFGTEL